MQNTLSRLKLWGQIILSILPGLWIIIWQSGIMGCISMGYGAAVLIILTLGILGVNATLDRRLNVWGGAALGALCWLGWIGLKSYWRYWIKAHLWIPSINRFYNQFGTLFKSDPTWLIWIVSLAFLFMVPYIIYRKSNVYLPKTSRRILGVMLFVTASYTLIFSLSTRWYLWFLLYDLFKLLLPLTFVFAGYNLAKIEGDTAVVFIASCMPLWIDMFLLPRFVYTCVHEFSAADLKTGLLLLNILPWFCFLLIIPVGGVVFSSADKLRRWFLIFTLLALFSIEVIKGLTLYEILGEYTVSVWLQRGVESFQVWVPLWFATTLYSGANQSPHSTLMEPVTS